MYYTIDGLKDVKTYDMAIVIGTYNRGKFLNRSLATYKKAIEGLDVAIIVIDDGSTDGTDKICEIHGELGLDIFYKKLIDKIPGTWRDSASFLNKGIAWAIKMLKANVVAVTHPEIMVGKGLLYNTYAVLMNWEDGIACLNQKGYYMTYDQQQLIDTVRWEDGIENIRMIDKFYENGKVGHEGYWHENIDKLQEFHNWIWAAMKSDDWIIFGGLGEFNQWGSVDLDFMARRWRAGVKTLMFNDLSCYVIHQNHDEPGLNSARNIDDAHKAIEIIENDNGLRPGTIEKYFKESW